MCSHLHIQTAAYTPGVSLSIPVMAPQPVVLAHVTAAIRGATPQQVMVAIMKYRKLRSIFACTCTHINKNTLAYQGWNFLDMCCCVPMLSCGDCYIQAPFCKKARLL